MFSGPWPEQRQGVEIRDHLAANQGQGAAGIVEVRACSQRREVMVRRGRFAPPPRRQPRSASNINYPHHVPTFEEEREYIPEEVDIPMNRPERVTPAMPTVNLGDISEMSEEANTTMPGIMDDASKFL